MTRDEAWQIVCEFVQSDGMRKHMPASRGATRRPTPSPDCFTISIGRSIRRCRIIRRRAKRFYKNAAFPKKFGGPFFPMPISPGSRDSR